MKMRNIYAACIVLLVAGMAQGYWVSRHIRYTGYPAFQWRDGSAMSTTNKVMGVVDVNCNGIEPPTTNAANGNVGNGDAVSSDETTPPAVGYDGLTYFTSNSFYGQVAGAVEGDTTGITCMAVYRCFSALVATQAAYYVDGDAAVLNNPPPPSTNFYASYPCNKVNPAYSMMAFDTMPVPYLSGSASCISGSVNAVSGGTNNLLGNTEVKVYWRTNSSPWQALANEGISGDGDFTGTVVAGVQMQFMVGMTNGAGALPSSLLGQGYVVTNTATPLVPFSFLWTNTLGGAWSIAGNWTNDLSNGSAPDSTGQSFYRLAFNVAGTFASTNDLNAGFPLNQLNFGGSTVTLAGNGLTLTNDNGQAPQINQNAALNITVKNDLLLARNVTVGGAGVGQVTLRGVLSGPGGLVMNGTWVLILPTTAANQTNSYAGGTTINSGVINYLNDPYYAGCTMLGTGPVTLNGGGLELQRSSANDMNTIVFNAGVIYENNGWGSSWGGPIILNTNAYMHGTYSALLLYGPMSGTGGIKWASNTLRLYGTNTYTGRTTVTNGFVELYNTCSVPPGDLYIQTTGVVRLNYGGTATNGGLYLNGVRQPDGVYGSTNSPATYQSTYFGGTGTVTVLGAFMIDITNITDMINTTNSTQYVAGTNNMSVVGMWWTNSLGGCGMLDPAPGSWNFTAPLYAGTNVISVSGTNFAGDVASDSVSVVRISATSQLPVTNGLSLWLDASQLTAVTNGQQVDTWNDMSGVGNHATRAASSSNGFPMYCTGVLNGLPVVRFYTNGNDYFAFSRISTIRSVFWVFKETTPARHHLLGDNSVADFHRSTGGSYPIWSVWTSPNITNGVTKLMGSVVNGITTPPGSEYRLVSLVTVGNVAASRICNDRGIANTSWDGDIAEILMYTNALTTGQEEQIGSYLADKYDLATAYTNTTAPFVDITNVNTTVANTVTNYRLGGTNNIYTVGRIVWTNSLGGNGSIPAFSTGWAFTVSLTVGSNVVTVTGTNIAGASSMDSVTIVRQPTTVPFVDITNITGMIILPDTSNTWRIAGTNNQGVVGGMVWTNSLGGNGSFPGSSSTGWSFNVTGLTMGYNAITVYGTNSVGNLATDTATICRGTPPNMKITNLVTTSVVIVPSAQATQYVAGTNNMIVGGMIWSNSMGGGARFPIATNWSFNASLSNLAYNTIRVWGTNVVGTIFADTVTVYRGETPYVDITNDSFTIPFFPVARAKIVVTNRAAVGTMWLTSIGGGVTNYTETITAAASLTVTVSNLLSGATNYVTVAGTNVLGMMTNDTIEIYRMAELPSTGGLLTNGLVVWLDANQITGLTDGQPVATWPDMSGNNHDATQTNTSYQPLFITNALNGKPVVRFAQVDYNTGSEMYLGDLSAYFPGSGTVFAVATIDNDGRYNLFGNRTGNDERWVADSWAESRPGSFRTGRSSAFSYGSWPQNGSHVYVVDNGIGASFRVAIDGTSIGSDTADYNTGSGANWVIGDRVGNGQQLRGDIPELILYNRVLDSDEANQVGGYLASKYGLTTAYPSNSVSLARILAFGPGATIDQTAKTIAWTVPYGSEITNLSPTYTVSSGTGVPASGSTHDFSSPVIYTVTDWDLYVINAYTVTVTIAPPPYVNITNANATVANTVTNCRLSGTNNIYTVGGIVWTNSLGGNGNIPAFSTGWAFSVSLAVGSNVVTVTGTNGAGVMTNDCVTIERGSHTCTTNYVALTGSSTAPFDSWATAATNIQTAVDAAEDGDLVLVMTGVYVNPHPVFEEWSGSIVSITNAVTVRAIGATPVSTEIDGYGRHARCVYLGHPQATIENFAIHHGRARFNIGPTTCFPTNCGGGIFFDGGGTAKNCTLYANSADGVNSGMGGAVYMNGGGLLRNCLLWDNVAPYGGGVYCTNGGIIESCTISANQTSGTNLPGGVWLVNGGAVDNSITWSNTTGDVHIEGAITNISYTSLCQGMPGMGNLTNNPQFVDANADNYRLQSISPCRDAGTNLAWMETATDLDGSQRVFGVAVDMGAYEACVVAPGAAQIIVASDGTYTNKVAVTWAAASNATRYAVWRNTGSVTNGASNISGDVTTTHFDDTTAIPGTTYWYWVKAGNGGGWSEFSVGDSGYAALPFSGNPTNVLNFQIARADNEAGYGQIRLSWSNDAITVLACTNRTYTTNIAAWFALASGVSTPWTHTAASNFPSVYYRIASGSYTSAYDVGKYDVDIRSGSYAWISFPFAPQTGCDTLSEWFGRQLEPRYNSTYDFPSLQRQSTPGGTIEYSDYYIADLGNGSTNWFPTNSVVANAGYILFLPRDHGAVKLTSIGMVQTNNVTMQIPYNSVPWVGLAYPVVLDMRSSGLTNMLQPPRQYSGRNYDYVDGQRTPGGRLMYADYFIDNWGAGSINFFPSVTGADTFEPGKGYLLFFSTTRTGTGVWTCSKPY